MTCNNTAALIYSALARVNLHTLYFSGINTIKQNSDYNTMENELKIARKLVLSQFIGLWSFKEAKLIQNPNLANGWHYAPSDYISWGSPKPEKVSTDIDNVPIYYFGATELIINYVYDREDLSNCPPELIECCKWYFLHNISTLQQFDATRIMLIDQRLMSNSYELSKLCSINREYVKYRGYI